MKVRFVYFTILLFAMCLMASCTHPEISSPNINQTNEIIEANETNESNQSIDPNAPLRLDNLNGMFTGFRDDFGGSERSEERRVGKECRYRVTTTKERRQRTGGRKDV